MSFKNRRRATMRLLRSMSSSSVSLSISIFIVAPETPSFFDLHKRSVRRAILVHKLPLPVDHQRLQVIVWVAAFVARRSVSHFKVDNLFLGFVDQSMAIARARLEPNTHARREPGSTFVGVKRWVPLQDVDELVLLGVSVAQRGHRPGSKPRQ